jgi:purine-nucleoside phosphorylase
MSDDVRPALRAIRERTDAEPETVLVLGSGLGALAETATDSLGVATSELPGYPQGRVEGHRGRLVFGRLEGADVLFVQGRLHCYEGHSARAAAFPVRLAHALGVRRMIVTNAAGGVNPSFPPGTLMFITDHLNLAFDNPLAGTPESTRARGSEPYDADWRRNAEEEARAEGVPVRGGTYAWTRGPSYETKAEIRAFRQLGADAVGMSTVPEVLQARSLGMSVLGLSTITNPAAGLSAGPLSHEEVLETGERVRDDLKRLVRGIVRET